MKEKFDPNKYLGPRRFVQIVGSPNVRRLFCWDKQKQRYVDPPRGNKYEARRSLRGLEKRECKTFESMLDARDWLSGVITTRQIEVAGYTIIDLIKDWRSLGWGHLSRSTKIFYERMIPTFEPLFGLQVESLHPKDIDDWIQLLKGPEWSIRFSKKRETLEKEYGLLKAVISWYIDRTDDTNLRSPFKKRHLQMLRLRPAKPKIRKAMYAEELEIWLAELKKNSFLFYAMAVVQISQVFRVSEVAAMKWSNLNLEHREYTVSEHVIWPRVNGEPPELLPGTKTHRSGEVFSSFLQLEAVEVLTELKANAGKSDLIFSKDGSLLTYRKIQYAYDKAFKRAKLPFRATHVCRHSGATSYLDMTGDVLALQQMGAWSNQQMALHYGKIGSSRAKEATLKAERKREHLKLIKNEEIS